MRKIRRICFPALFFILVPSVPSALSATIHIPADQPTIQQGIEAAEEGALVLVAPGTYVENLDFLGKAVMVQSETGAEDTIVDGNRAGSVVKFIHSETEQAVIDGFTLRNGSGTPYDDSFYGGGVYCMNYSHPTITNCTITENIVFMAGGGIDCWEYSSPTIRNCLISRNTAGGVGGGISLLNSDPTIEDCTIIENIALSTADAGGINCNYSNPAISNSTISRNTSSRGGGILCYYSDPTITSCTIAENVAEDNGGGIRCFASSPTITNCTISGNRATTDGGGIFAYNASSPTITGSTISGNEASDIWSAGGGLFIGGICDATIRNCTIVGNRAVDGGGGIFYGTGTADITNCTIMGNSAEEGGGIFGIGSFQLITNCTFTGNSAESGGGIKILDSTPIMTNCILWGNSALEGPELAIRSYSTLTVSFSDVQGGETAATIEPGSMLYWLDGNMDSNPLFVGAEEIHLSKGSPCIDAGDPDPSFQDECLPPSLGSEQNDMGTYGGPGACAWCGDHDGDGYSSEVCSGGDDCDDSNPDVNPDASEVCDNGMDDDCDDLVDRDDPDCIVEFTLELGAHYGSGHLILNFTLNTPEPAMWATYMLLTSPTPQLITLWALPLPAIDPPMDVPVAFPFPSLGWIGIYTGLFTEEGAQAFDLAWVNTG